MSGADEMAADPDNLVLSHLRDIRTDIAQMASKLASHDKRFDKLDDRLDPHEYQLTNALRFAAMANLGAQNAEAHVIEVAERQKQLELRMAEFDRRLKQIEDPQTP
jgi:predicted  nucleic acid-binding Zn-ribbon protein